MSARSARVGGGRTNEAAATAGARSMSGPETKPETKTTGRQTGRQHANQYNRKFAEVHKQSEMAQSLSGSHKATATTMNVRDIMLHSAREEWDLVKKNLGALEHVEKLVLLLGRAARTVAPALRSLSMNHCQLTAEGTKLLAGGIARSSLTRVRRALAHSLALLNAR